MRCLATGELTDPVLADDGKDQAAKVFEHWVGAARAAKMRPERQMAGAVRPKRQTGIAHALSAAILVATFAATPATASGSIRALPGPVFMPERPPA
jgi:hypothetical protein